MNRNRNKTERIAIPVKDGIGASQVALPPGLWKTYEEFLADKFPVLTFDEWARRVREGEVLYASGKCIEPGTPYRPGQKLYYYRTIENERKIPFEEEILYQDEWLVVADKPHFLPVVPSGKYARETLLARLRLKLGIDSLTPIHRIDRETAGLVLFSTKPEARDHYQRLFRENYVSKHYEAIAQFTESLTFPKQYRCRLEQSSSFMQMKVCPGKPNAETHISILETSGKLAHYLLKPITGRKHQLRVQMASLGIPILNDRIYPRHLPESVTDEMLQEEFRHPLQLVAKSIRFTDPITGEERHFESHHSLELGAHKK